jgi:YHS domain-containing protein
VIRIILILLLLIFIARAFWRVIDGIMEAMGGLPKKKTAGPRAVKLVRDPVCGTFVAPRESMSLTRRGETHYFCSEQCRASYRKSA